MANFRGFTHIDTFALGARLLKFSAQLIDKPLVVRDKGESAQFLTEWKSLQRVLNKVQDTLGYPDPALDVTIIRTPKNTPPEWERVNDLGYDTFVVPLVTNPGVLHYRRHEFGHYPVGTLFWDNHFVVGGRSNWGFDPAYHLIMTFLKIIPEANDTTDVPVDDD